MRWRPSPRRWRNGRAFNCSARCLPTISWELDVGLFTGILTAPLAPLRMTIAIAEQIRLQAEEEFYDPSRISSQLREVDRLRAIGELDDAEADELEEQLLDRLLRASNQA